MAYHARRRTQHDFGQCAGDPESKYSSWKNERPELFRTSPAEKEEGPMATTNTTMTHTPIAVIADNEEHLVHLPNTIRDTKLDKSMLGKQHAFATKGQFTPTKPINLTTESGQCFSSSNTISLRWRYDGGLQSFQETFWIVDGIQCPGAILRHDIERMSDDASAAGRRLGVAFPIRFGKPNKQGVMDQKEREKIAEQRDREFQDEKEKQRKAISRELTKGKMR